VRKATKKVIKIVVNSLDLAQNMPYVYHNRA
jgi:hypothetical protein